MDFQNLVSNFPIVSWVQQTFPGARIGHDQITMDCPFCGGQAKLGISIQKKLIRCFRCDSISGGGHGPPLWTGRANLFQFLALYYRDKREAFDLLKEKSGLPDEFIPPPQKPKQDLIPSEAIPLDELPEHEPAIQMLKRRGVEHLIPDAYVCARGYYKDRIVLSCRYNKILVGSECKGIYPSQQPKSLFHPPGQFLTGKTVYTQMNWKPGTTAVLTESIFDAETWNGVENSLGLYGSSLSESQVAAILGLGIERLVWALDWDAFLKTLRFFRQHALGVFDNYFIRFPENQDSNSVGKDVCGRLLREAAPIKDEWDLLKLGVDGGLLCL